MYFIILGEEVAIKVLDCMKDILSRFSYATVSDLHDLIGVESNYKDDQNGWTSLDSAEIIKNDAGWCLVLSDPQKLTNPIGKQLETKKQMTKDQLIESATTFLGLMTIQAQQESGGELQISLDGGETTLVGDDAMTVILETQRPIATMMVDYLIADGLELKDE